MERRAAADDDEAADRGEFARRQVEAREDGRAGGRVKASADRVPERVGLLVNLLDHEVLVAALLDRAEIPVDLLHLARDGRIVERVDGHALGRYACDVPVLEVDDLARVGDDRGDIARDDGLVLPDADAERGALAGDDHLARMLRGNGGDAVGALDLFQGLGDGGEEVALVEGRDEVREDLGVGLGEEPAAALLESRPKRRIVLDDAVVDERKAAVVCDMRMRVGAVRRPARVGDSDRVLRAVRLGLERLLQELVEFGDLAGLLVDANPVRPLKRNARGVIAAVFKATESVDKRTHSRGREAGKADDSTHISQPFSLRPPGTAEDYSKN